MTKESWKERGLMMNSMKVCPECKSKNITETIYGLPGGPPDKELQKEIDAGRAEFGGCCIYPESKRLHCNDCLFEWGRP